MSSTPSGLHGPRGALLEHDPQAAVAGILARARTWVPAALVVAAYLLTAQRVVAIASSTDALAAIVESAVIWLAGGSTLAVLFAVTSRSAALLAVTAAVAAVDAVGYLLLGALGELGPFAPPTIALPLLVSFAAAAVALLGRGAARRHAVARSLAIVGVLGQAAISLASPLVTLGASEVGASTLARTVAIPLVAVAVAVLLDLRGRAAEVCAAVAMLVLAATLAVSPVVSALGGTPPVAAALVVIVARSAIVTAAAIVMLAAPRR